MQVEPIFPQAVLYVNKVNINCIEILKYLTKIKFIKTNNTEAGHASCYISEDEKIFEELSLLKIEIYSQIKNYLKNVMKLKMDFQFTSSWATRTDVNGYSQTHNHLNSFISGVYYPKGDKNFNIKFYKEQSFWNIVKTEVNYFNAQDLTINIAEDSTLILFPSSLRHSIEKNLSKETRYSIAFNTLPFGEIGTGDSKVNFK